MTVPKLPSGLASDGSSLYAAFSNGSIHRYGLDGALLASMMLPGASWTGITYGNGQLFVSGDSNTPEPATTTLVAVLLYLRRRRRRA